MTTRSTGAHRDEIVAQAETLEAEPVAGVGPHEGHPSIPCAVHIHPALVDLHRS